MPVVLHEKGWAYYPNSGGVSVSLEVEQIVLLGVVHDASFFFFFRTPLRLFAFWLFLLLLPIVLSHTPGDGS